MSRPTDSPLMSMVALAVMIAVAIGIQREGFAAAENATNATNSSVYANTTAGQLDAFAGTFVEILPLLVLAFAGIAVLRTVQ